MKDSKQIDIEIMRIIAAFFVIFNHTGMRGYFLFSTYDGSNSERYWIYLFISIFCKLSVPLFFMISGALMLNRQPQPLKTLLCKKVFHVCAILTVWSFFYYIMLVSKGTEAFEIRRFLRQLYDSNWNFSYWYLYAYIAFLLTLPLMQQIAQNLSNRNYIYMFSLYALFSMLLPSTQYLIWQGRHSLNINAQVTWISANIFIFPLAGYFLRHRARCFWNKRRLLVLWGINICMICLVCYLTYFRSLITGVCDESNSQVFHNTFVLINAASIFSTLQYLCDRHVLKPKAEKLIISIGGYIRSIFVTRVFYGVYQAASIHGNVSAAQNAMGSYAVFVYILRSRFPVWVCCNAYNQKNSSFEKTCLLMPNKQ